MAYSYVIRSGGRRVFAPRRSATADAELLAGTVADVLGSVGTDSARARVLLDAERTGRNRATLTRELERIAGDG